MYTSTEFEQHGKSAIKAASMLNLEAQEAFLADGTSALGKILAVTSPRLRERLALYNRVFGIMAGDDFAEEVHIARATDELAAILRLVFEDQGLLFAPVIFLQSLGECGVVCEGHPQNSRLQACLEQIHGLASAVQHLLHMHYSGQVVREYRRFQEHYRQSFAMWGREEANRLSVRYESSPCPAPQLVFDGRITTVVFAGKPACQRMTELKNVWQPKPPRTRQRTVDRYFPAMLARHML